MLACVEVELGDTVLCPCQDDLGRVNTFDVSCHTDWHASLNYLDGFGSFMKIDHKKLVVIDVHEPELMALRDIVGSFSQTALRDKVGLKAVRKSLVYTTL